MLNKTIDLPSFDFRPINRKGRVGEVVFALTRPNGEVWLHYKKNHPKNGFRLTGGGIESGESVSEALVREVFEETGFKVEANNHIAQIDYVSIESRTFSRFITYLYIVPVNEDDPQTLDDSEGILEWKPCDIDLLERHRDILQSQSGSRKAWGIFRAATISTLLEHLAGI